MWSIGLFEVFHLMTSPLPVKGCKFLPILSTLDHWAEGVLERATPSVTRDIRAMQSTVKYWISPFMIIYRPFDRMLYSGHYIMLQYLKCIFIIHFQQWPILCSIVKSVVYKVCGGEKGIYFAFFAYRKDLNCLILINACLLDSASVTRQGVNPVCWPVSHSTSSSPSRLTTTASLGLMDQ